jgi:hypothetical protein
MRKFIRLLPVVLLVAAMLTIPAPVFGTDDAVMGIGSEDMPDGVVPGPAEVSNPDDAALVAEIQELLDTHLSDGPAIEVEATDGVVTLSGFVEVDSHREVAEEMAAGVPGVRRVDNQIMIASESPVG